MATNGANIEAVEEGKSLFDRVEEPPVMSIPKDVARQIGLIEHELLEAELEQQRQAISLTRSIYAKRNALIASKELQNADFWPRVFANAPAEIDEYILPSDAGAISDCLKTMLVERIEVDEKTGQGEPRSVRFTFEFASGSDSDGDDINTYFTNEKLVKDFYWRKRVTRSPKGKRRVWEGYVSTPVRIHWKEGQDLTNGLLDAACDLYEAEQKNNSIDRASLPEYEKLVKMIEDVDADIVEADEDGDGDEDMDDFNISSRSPARMSFFAWFGYRGPNVTAGQSQEAVKEEAERWSKIATGETVEGEEEYGDDDDDADDDEDYEPDEAELFPDGEDLAIDIAEELWPSALKFYVQSYEVPEEFDSDIDLEEFEDMEEDEEENGEEDKAGGESNLAEGDEEDEEDRPRKKAKV